MPSVSVIVPVYNAGAYVDACVASIEAQTVPDWELILVDDCSTDDSEPKCRAHAARDGRIRVLRTPRNSGPAAARNLGIEAARGRYLAFVDSDDAAEPLFLERLTAAAEAFDAEIVWGNYRECSADRRQCCDRLHDVPNDRLLPRDVLLGCYFRETCGLGSMCTKLYRRDFVERHGLRIDPARVLAEDWAFNLAAFQRVERVVAIGDVLYDYIRRGGSVMATYRRSDWEQLCPTQRMLDEVARTYGLRYDEGGFLSRTLAHFLTQVRLMAGHEADAAARLRALVADPYGHRVVYGGDACCLSRFQTLLLHLLRARMFGAVVALVRLLDRR